MDTVTACKCALQQYQSIWNKDTDKASFWQKSNQMDSYLRFAQLCTLKFPNDTNWFALVPDQQSKFLADFQAYVQDALYSGREDLWTDDYGWGGIACISVARWMQLWHPTWIDYQFPNQYAWVRYAKYAIDCWKWMYDMAQTSKGGSPVPDGLSNQPKKPDEGVVYSKNTVTGANYFVLSMQLFIFLQQSPHNATGLPPVIPQQKLCLQAAYDQYVWFKGWINITPSDPSLPCAFYHPITTDAPANGVGFMLEERPVSYPPYSGYTPANDPDKDKPIYVANAGWIGDQGLFLHGCALLYSWAGNLVTFIGKSLADVRTVQTDIAKWMPQIAAGVWSVLTNKDGDSILRDFPFSNIMSDYADSYVCGRGVFARFLLQEDTINVFNTVGIAPVDPNRNVLSIFYQCFQATANAIYGTARNNQLTANWSTTAADNAYYTKFLQLWKAGDWQYPWPNNTSTSYIFNNFCMINGFDIYSAWIKVNANGMPSAIGKEQAYVSKHDVANGA